MLFIIEVFLLVYGIIALVRKEWSIGGGRKVVGGHAVALGWLSVAVLPVILVLGVGFGFIWGISRGNDEFPTLAVALVELAIVVGAGITLVALGKKFHAQQEALRARQAGAGAQAPQGPPPSG